MNILCAGAHANEDAAYSSPVQDCRDCQWGYKPQRQVIHLRLGLHVEASGWVRGWAQMAYGAPHPRHDTTHPRPDLHYDWLHWLLLPGCGCWEQAPVRPHLLPARFEFSLQEHGSDPSHHRAPRRLRPHQEVLHYGQGEGDPWVEAAVLLQAPRRPLPLRPPAAAGLPALGGEGGADLLRLGDAP